MSDSNTSTEKETTPMTTQVSPYEQALAEVTFLQQALAEVRDATLDYNDYLYADYSRFATLAEAAVAEAGRRIHEEVLDYALVHARDDLKALADPTITEEAKYAL